MSDWTRGKPCRRCLTRVVTARPLGGGVDRKVVVDAERVRLTDEQRREPNVWVLGLLAWTLEPGADVEMRADRDGLLGPYHREHVCRSLRA